MNWRIDKPRVLLLLILFLYYALLIVLFVNSALILDIYIIILNPHIKLDWDYMFEIRNNWDYWNVIPSFVLIFADCVWFFNAIKTRGGFDKNNR